MGHDGRERGREVKPWSGVPYSHYHREGTVGYEERWVKSACAGQLTKVTAVDMSQRVDGARPCCSRHPFAFVTFLIEKSRFSISFVCVEGEGARVALKMLP